ncbi:MAG: sulfite exporter TauE/SafE family protein [Pseudomonadota bacterium]|nr:sulfite exporter TauE/SafE family protein [Pseudomonadota bacterium]
MSDFLLLGQNGQFWTLALVAVLLMGVSKGGFGSGLNVVSTPLLALASSPALAAAVMLPLLNAMDMLGLRAFWRQWDAPTARSLVLPMLAGVILGTLLFTVVDPDMLRILLALVCYYVLAHRWGILRRLRLVAADAEGRTQTPRPGGLVGWILGGLLGITSTIAHAGGPAAAAYLLRFNFDKTTFQATTILTFTIVNIIKLPFYFAIGQFPVSTLILSLVLLPFAAAGMILGVFLHRMVPQRPFFVLMEGALFVTASKLVWDGSRGLMGLA